MPPEQDDSQNASPEPKYVTADDIGNIVNAAVSSHLKRSLGTAIEAALKPALEQLKAAAPPPPQASDDGDDKKKSKQSPELLAMAKKVEDMEKALAAEKERVVAAEKKQREDRAFADLRSNLEGKVRPELLDIVAQHLFTVEKRVEFDEQGNTLFRHNDEYSLPLRNGVEEFLKGETAKAFLPAPSSGAGAPPLPKRGPSPNMGGTDFSKPATTDAEKARRAAEREQMARQKLAMNR